MGADLRSVVPRSGGTLQDRFEDDDNTNSLGLEGLRADVTVNNVFGNEYRAYIGYPEVGRFALARLTYEF